MEELWFEPKQADFRLQARFIVIYFVVVHIIYFLFVFFRQAIILLRLLSSPAALEPTVILLPRLPWESWGCRCGLPVLYLRICTAYFSDFPYPLSLDIRIRVW